jgi:predicted porin
MAVTAANAVALEEAIKNVDVSGKVYIEHVATTTDGADEESKSLTDIDVDITVKSKVNDNVTAVVRVQADKEDYESTTHTNSKGDTNPFGAQDVTVDNVYFTYVNGGLTANFGKQDINTPNTDGEIGNGILALYNIGPVTVAGAHFTETELFDSQTNALAVLGTVGPVNAEAWYVKVNAHSDNVTLAASTKIANVSLAARYATTDFDDALKKDGETIKVGVSTTFGPIGVSASYFTTDDDNAAFVTDASSANAFELTQLAAKNLAGLDAYAIGASYTMDAMKYQLDYAAAEQKVANAADTEHDELRLRATYTMSKNFKVMATYSMYEVDAANNADDKESDSARIEARYSF